MSGSPRGPPHGECRSELESMLHLQRGAPGPYASSCFFQEGSWVVVMKPIGTIYRGKIHPERTLGVIVGAGRSTPKAAAVSSCHMEDGFKPAHVLNNREQTNRVLQFMKSMKLRVRRSWRDNDVKGRYFASHVECKDLSTHLPTNLMLPPCISL